MSTLDPDFSSVGRYPAVRNWRRRMRIREANSPAALRVKVSPRISSGRTIPLATNQRTLADMVSVFPDPAPAITTVGPK